MARRAKGGRSGPPPPPPVDETVPVLVVLVAFVALVGGRPKRVKENKLLVSVAIDWKGQ